MNKETTTVRVPKEMWEKIQQIALRYRRSATSQCIIALDRHIDEEEGIIATIERVADRRRVDAIKRGEPCN